MSTNFAKTLFWKHGNDVKLWRHKQRTPNANDPEPNPPHENFLRTPLHLMNIRMHIHGPDMNGEDRRTSVESSYTTQLRIQDYSSVIAQHKNFLSNAFDDHPGIDLFRAAVSNPNGLLSQNVCYYLSQGRTLKDISRAAHGMAYFVLCKLNSASDKVLKTFGS